VASEEDETPPVILSGHEEEQISSETPEEQISSETPLHTPTSHGKKSAPSRRHYQTSGK